jgi:hypothetical protein
MSTTKPTAPKATKAAKTAPVKKAKKLPEINDFIDSIIEEGEEEGGKIKMILTLYIKGYSRKDIIAVGYNKTTVYRQTGELEKLRKAPAIQYYGFELFEARLQRVMKAKGMTREEAFDLVSSQDIDSK